MNMKQMNFKNKQRKKAIEEEFIHKMASLTMEQIEEKYTDMAGVHFKPEHKMTFMRKNPKADLLG